MFGMPLVFLPCREALLSMPVLFRKLMVEGDVETQVDIPSPSVVSAKMTRMSGLTKDGHVVINGIDFDEEMPLLKRNSSIIPLAHAVKMGNIIPMNQLVNSGFGQYGSNNSSNTRNPPSNTSDHSTDTSNPSSDSGSPSSDENDLELLKNFEKVPDLPKDSLDASSKPPLKELLSERNNVKQDKGEGKQYEVTNEGTDEGKVEISNAVHIVSTLCILAVGYFCAVAVPGVGLVWSICGSSMSLIIGFFIPAACYLKIRSRKKLNPRSLGAWSMVIFSIIASVVCTIHVVESNKLGNN
jgi:hypothetical protein